MKGTHIDANRYTIVDFDLILNLTSLLDLSVPDNNTSSSTASSSNNHTAPHLSFKELPLDTPSTSSGGSRLFKRSEKQRPSQTPPSPLQVWCAKYVSDKSENKTFVLTRVISHFVPLQQTLEGSLRTLLHTLQYRGKVEVTFPTHQSTVAISKKPGNWFVSMLGMYPEKRFDVVESVWGWRGHLAGTREDGGGDGDVRERSERGFKVDEANARGIAEEYWGDWRETVRNSVLRGVRGKVGVEEWIESAMGRREKDRGKEWGVDGSWSDSTSAWGKWTGEEEGL